VLGCNIHDTMAGLGGGGRDAHHGLTGASGRVRLADVPPGSYRLRSWHPDLPTGAPALDQALVVGPQGAAASVRLPCRAARDDPMPQRRQRLSTRIVARCRWACCCWCSWRASWPSAPAWKQAHASTLQQELEVGERVWRRLLDQKSATLTQGATLLAADYGFRSAVATADADTIASVLENHAARIGAGVSAWIDNDFRLRSASGEPPMGGDRAFEALALDMARQGRGSQVGLVGERAMQLVSVPLKAPCASAGWCWASRSTRRWRRHEGPVRAGRGLLVPRTTAACAARCRHCPRQRP
jgi:hypothetical protein